jgi:hypothetical protein
MLAAAFYDTASLENGPILLPARCWNFLVPRSALAYKKNARFWNIKHFHVHTNMDDLAAEMGLCMGSGGRERHFFEQ